jgi:hypothetical protein
MKPAIAFDVILNNKVIDTVFYSVSSNVDELEVKQSLINHDGYHPNIKVMKRN